MDLSADAKNNLNLSPFDYDSLENELYQMENETEIYRRVSYWFTKKLNCSFVLFYVNRGKSMRDRVKYYGEKVHSMDKIGTVVDERIKKAPDKRSVFVHQSGAISIPIKYTNTLSGFIFIGPRTDGKSYNYEEQKILRPVDRIVSHSLLVLDVVDSRKQKDRLRYAFSRYVSPEVVNNIMISQDTIHPGGKKQELTVIFTDLEKFTQLSEGMEPKKLLLVLNMYLNEMSQVILSLGGTIDKYEGDAIMAFFGAPRNFQDHAVRCCLSALRMKKMESVLNEQLAREKLVSRPLFTRIGINTGEMIVGNVGSMERLDYTVIGNNVNIAARIETANKEYGTSILISEATYNLVKDYFICREVASAHLKGVSEPVIVYELMDVNSRTIPNYNNYTEVNVDDVEEVEESDEDEK